MEILDFLDPSDIWDRRTIALWIEAQHRHEGKISLQSKRGSMFFKAIAILFKIVTLGFGQDLVETYYTAFSHTIYLPGDGSHFGALAAIHRYAVMCHEIAHIDDLFLGDPDAQDKDFREFAETSKLRKFFLTWIRYPVVCLAYVLWPFPFVFAYGRQRFEIAGYYRTIAVYTTANDGRLPHFWRRHIEKQFHGPAYGWMATKKRSVEIVAFMVHRARKAYLDGDLKHLEGEEDPLPATFTRIAPRLEIETLRQRLSASPRDPA